jgi:hypothetical protein
MRVRFLLSAVLRYPFSDFRPLVIVAMAWRVIYAFWTPLVNRYIVPPGDDPVFHLARVADLLAGKWQLFFEGYPLGWHLLTAIVAKIAGWDPLTAIRLIGPVLLVLPIPVLYFVGKRLFTETAGALAALIWSFLALAPIRAYGDGNYPNMLAGSVLLPVGLLFLLMVVRRPERKIMVPTVAIFIALALVHHLTFIYSLLLALPLLFWWSWQVLSRPGRQRAWLNLTASTIIVVGGAGLLLWPFYQPLLGPFLKQLTSQGSLAFSFGAASTPVSLSRLLEIHNPLFIVLGVAGVLLILMAKIDRATSVLMVGWIGLLWLLSTTSIFGLPERFARELAIPLALTGGFFLSFLIDRAKTWGWRVIFLSLPLVIVFLDWRASFERPFALPDPYKPLIRVQREEEPAILKLKEATPPGGTILANNSNPYLSFLVDRRVLIATNPDSIETTLVSELVTTLFIGSRPPLTPPDQYPFYSQFEAIRGRLLAVPNKEKVLALPTGTEIYRLNR